MPTGQSLWMRPFHPNSVVPPCAINDYGILWDSTYSFINLMEKGTATTAAQISAGGVADDSLIQNEGRLQAAAAAAASLYEKSLTYPSANTPVWSPGYALIPQVQRPLADRTTVESGGEQGFIGQQHLQFSIHGGPSNLSFPQLPHCVFIPFQAPSASPAKSAPTTTEARD
ncbi:hypothetical protein D5086_024677 [Populus alba]|uniref:Uncharacterized protein n=1 Tax=Populus alba TaxID=43335 RepID=A0ACC4B658_POPAL